MSSTVHSIIHLLQGPLVSAGVERVDGVVKKNHTSPRNKREMGRLGPEEPEVKGYPAAKTALSPLAFHVHPVNLSVDVDQTSAVSRLDGESERLCS